MDREPLVGLFLALATASGCATGASAPGAQPAGASARPSVVIISIDGLRPEFYRAGSGWEAPTLQKLARSGATAESAEPIFPSLTYPSHTSIVTGVRSATHGIYSNTVFSYKDGPTPVWYWDAERIQAPTIWQRAKAAGYKTAILTWPGTVGGQADWLIPEIFPSPPATVGTTWELMQKNMDPMLTAELQSANPELIPDAFEPRDRWLAAAAEHVLRADHPDFALIHIINVDHVQHEKGKDAADVHEALLEADGQLARLVSAIDLSRTTLIVLGDHGFYDYDKVVRPNVLFARQGWLRETKGEKGPVISPDWKVITHPGGGAAAIYARRPGLAPKVVELLKKNAGSRYRVVEREELDRLGAFPGAVCALDPATRENGGPGYSVSLEAHGAFVQKLPAPRGNHGPIPTDPDLNSGFIAVGPGIAAGKNLGPIRLLDVAPTVARLIHVPLSEAEGRPIELY